jgi:hypothetical protein
VHRSHAFAQGTQTDIARTPCHHEHLLNPSGHVKKSQAAPKTSSAGAAEIAVEPPLAVGARARGGRREYILQHSPQRAGVTSVGIRNMPSSPKAAAGARKQLSNPLSSSATGTPSIRKSPAAALEPKAAKCQQALQSGESAEATAWLSVARDDAAMLASALMHAPVNLADEDGETLLLCACRCASGVQFGCRPTVTTNFHLQMLERFVRTVTD